MALESISLTSGYPSVQTFSRLLYDSKRCKGHDDSAGYNSYSLQPGLANRVARVDLAHLPVCQGQNSLGSNINNRVSCTGQDRV